MPAPGVIAVILAGPTLFSLAALCVCTMAAEVMMLKLRPPAQIDRCPPGLNCGEVSGPNCGHVDEMREKCRFCSGQGSV